MRTVLTALTVFVLTAGSLQAGLFSDSVDLKDLVSLSPEGLQSLKETEFAVFLAEVELAAAKARESRARGGEKTAEKTLEIELLDLAAAEAERLAAEANEDSPRISAAEAQLRSDKSDLELVRALQDWKEQEIKAREKEVAMAKAQMDLAEAERDAARVRQLRAESLDVAAKYDLSDYESTVGKRRRSHERAATKAQREAVTAEQLKLKWEGLLEERRKRR